MSSFTKEQLDELTLMFETLGQEIGERANRDYCSEGAASVDAVSNVASVIQNFEPGLVHLHQPEYEGN